MIQSYLNNDSFKNNNNNTNSLKHVFHSDLIINCMR